MAYDFLKNTWSNFERDILDKKLFLFGASQKCQKFMQRYGEQLEGKIEAVCDNNTQKHGGLFCGMKIVSPEELHKQNKEEIAVLITSSYMREIAVQLEEMGVYNYYLSDMLNESKKMWLGPIPESAHAEIKELREVLEDDKSKQLLDAIVEKRNNRIKVWYDLNDHTGYFNTGIVELKPGDSFVDGGAYIGDTIDEALARAELKRVLAYEPDKENFDLLTKKYGNKANITCKCAGVWSDNGVLSFNSVGNIGSSIKEGGSVRIQTIALDKDIHEKVDFIKLDIEGAEIEALKGAEQLIKKYHPKLAICVYHKQEDLWKIPLLIKKMVPEYHVYLRHQSDYFYDTVMFAHV